MKIVLNSCYGGFGLSNKAFERLIELGFPHITEDQEAKEDFESNKLKILIFNIPNQITGEKYIFLENDYELEELRTHPLLIQVVTELEKDANDSNARLEIKEIPDTIKEIHIEDDNGIEKVYDWETGARIL